MQIAENPLRDLAMRAAGRISESDTGVIVVVIDANGYPTVYPAGVNMAGRFKALASAVDTLAKEVPEAIGKTLHEAGAKIGAAANLLIPEQQKGELLAREGETFTVAEGTEVLYGAAEGSVVKTVGGEVVCNNATFGDPAHGVVKACYRLPG